VQLAGVRWYDAGMETVVLFVVCLVLWLLFPKGFRFMVGSLVGACGGGLLWGIAVLCWTAALGHDVSWDAMAKSLIAAVTAGAGAGWALAARG